ncbi:MAG: FMN-binding negative transcriptional regulator [Chloroflexota bacterium]
MYIPKHYLVEDRKKIWAFMRANSFATLVTIENDSPLATHLPFVIGENGEVVRLTSHLAKANPQWKNFESRHEALVIFQGPHAYISPDHYDHKQNVPTWNYVAVHVYGIPVILKDEAHERVITSMIDSFQATYKHQYDELPDDYKRKMINGTVAFEINVTRLEAKHKLSQNRSISEQIRVAESLVKSEDQAAIEVGTMMKEHLR